MTTDGYRSAQAAYDAAEPDDSERVECPRCHGSGFRVRADARGEPWDVCLYCEGEGEVRR